MFEHDDFIIAALLEEGRLEKAVIDAAVREGAERKLSAADAIVAKGLVTSREMALVRAGIAEAPFVDLSAYEIDIRNSKRLPRVVAESLRVFPLFDLGDVVTVAAAAPLDLRGIDQVRSLLRAEIETVVCEPEAIARLIERAYALTGNSADDGPEVQSGASLTTGREPIVAAVNHILAQAIERGASDVHIGPDEHTLHLRLRVDGQLQVQQGPALSAHAGIVQRLKVMAGLDLTQTRRAQDGKFRFTHEGRSVDIRVSMMPTVCGENVVLRLLSSAGQIKGFPELGLSNKDRDTLERLLGAPNGMLLVTGPTGCGKTTTLYTCLKKLNTPDVNIMTIEDPVEVRMPMVRQIQATPEIGMTFAGALRSILRQDPDVVLVGEVRDEDTAKIATQAALTGHLVLSSLHTNDAPGAVPRLVDLGVPSFAVNASVLGVIGQRLVRRVCADCSAVDTPEPHLLTRFGLNAGEAKLMKGTGCPRCSGLGYKGRVGLYEIMVMTPAIHRAVDKGASGRLVAEAAVRGGMMRMWDDGLAKARLGLTTLQEIAQVAALVAENLDDADDAMPPVAVKAAA